MPGEQGGKSTETGPRSYIEELMEIASAEGYLTKKDYERLTHTNDEAEAVAVIFDAVSHYEDNPAEFF